MYYHSVYTSEILINARLNVLLSVRFAQLNVSFCYMHKRNIVDSGEDQWISTIRTAIINKLSIFY